MTVSATKDAVFLAMKNLAARGDRVYFFSVLEETKHVVRRNTGGEIPDSLFWEAVDSLQQEGTIDPQRDWRILDHSGRNLDRLAEETVFETIETLSSSPIPANSHTVPDRCEKLLFQRASARIDIGEAREFINKAIQTLDVAGRIECPAEPYKRWRIVR